MSRFYVSNKPDRNGLFQVKDKKNECAYTPFFYSYKGAVAYCDWLKNNFEKSDSRRYIEFVNMYNSGKISVKNIMKKLALTERDYKKLRKLAIKNGHLNVDAHDSSKSYDNVKDNKQVYTTNSGKYKVSKIIDGRTVNYGVYRSRKEADYVARRLKECNWDGSKLPEILKDLQSLKRGF